MRYYAKDVKNRDIFFVEIVQVFYGNGEEKDEDDIFYYFDEDWFDMNDFIWSSLPIQIFSILDVNRLTKMLFEKLLKSIPIFDDEISMLICLIKSKEHFSFYYFQEIELNELGHYDENKAEVMNTFLDKLGVESGIPYSIHSTPFQFRFICEKLNLIGILDELIEIYKNEFEFAIQRYTLIIDSYIDIINSEMLYRKMHVEIDGVNSWLFVLLRQNYPQLLFILPAD
ncbi:MAG: hypothetical protein IPN61_00585 [Bacteroidetes bacterium]|nr:hypothetical protein [Bacteroidota bacterium]